MFVTCSTKCRREILNSSPASDDFMRSSRSISMLLVSLHQTSKCHSTAGGDPANSAAVMLESCTDPSLLSRAHAQMLRRHWLRYTFHWNALARCYLRLTFPRSSLLVFALMSRVGFSPDCYSLPIALKAASHCFDMRFALQVHSVALKHGLGQNEFTESGLISIYTKMSEFVAARKVFDENSGRKLGSWNGLINGYAQAGESRDAISIFIEMLRTGLVPDDVTMVSVASATGSLGDICLAEQVHKCALQAARFGRLHMMLDNALLDMYAKCGRTDLAYKVFDAMAEPNVSSWTAMISGFAMHGQELHALDLFRQMVQEGVNPNHVTFVGVLSACAHTGLVDEGMAYFEAMAGQYDVQPNVAHYGCIIDMLGRVGRLAEARAMIEQIPMNANSVIYGTLLGACEKHGNVEVGEWAAKNLIELEPWNDGVYVVLSNVYAAAKLWPEVMKMRRLMKEKTVAKIPGYSSAIFPN